MKKYDLNKDFPDQKGWLEMCSPEEKKAFIFGCCCFDTETDEGKIVFTLRAARKCSLTELYAIQSYMIMSDKVDILNEGKAAISFDNILKAEKEHYPPPSKEEKLETQRKLIEFKKSHPEFFGVIEEEGTDE